MKKKFGVGGMTCSACSLGIEKRVSRIDGVREVSVSLMDKSMTVTFNDDLPESEILSAVTDLGYSVYAYGEQDRLAPEATALRNRFLFSLAFLLPLLYFSMGGMIRLPEPSRRVSFLVQWVLSAVIIGVNHRFFTAGTRALVKGVPNMDTLVALASSVAFLYSSVITVTCFAGMAAHHVFFEASAMVLTLVTLGKYLEEKSKSRTGREIEKLVKMIPETVRVMREDKEVIVPASEIAVGDVISVRQGDRLPVDGVVIKGSAFLDNSAITGESLPVEVQEGKRAVSGGMVTNGHLLIRAEKVGEDTAFARIVEMVRTASSAKAPVQKAADKIAGIFVPIVTFLAILTFGIWLGVTRDLDRAFRFGVSVLVISCPCALGLATPVAVMAAVGKGATLGVLYKNAESIEVLSKTNCLLLDKTATLTQGKPQVVAFHNLSDLPDQEVFSLVRAAEEASSHPLAECIKSYCGESAKHADFYEYFTGKGAVVSIAGARYYIGNGALLPFAQNRTWEEKYPAGTVVYFASEEKLLALFVLADKLKEGTKEVMDLLASYGYKRVMLTGDNLRVAQTVAEEAGIREVKAEMLPEDKEKVAASYRKQGYVTAMTGDGINDSPALKTADVGIAMGSGTDVAVDAADVVLGNGEIRTLADALLLAKKTFRVIKGNLFWAFFYNVAAIPVAAGAFASLGLALTPTISAAAMSLSSLFVVTNALRINGYKGVNFKTERSESQEQCSEKEECDMCFVSKENIVLSVEGMMCEHCKARVEKALSSVAGVKKVKVDLAAKTATVQGSADKQALVDAVTQAGYEVNN